jgi:hypothetical protein
MRLGVAIAGAGLLLTAPLWAGGAETGDPVAGVWKEQHLTFTYMGRTSRYSCDGLRDKVLALLMDLGARRDMKITPVGCVEARPSTRLGWLSPSLALVFSSPALPDPSVQPLHAGDLAAVDARFEPFSLTSDAFRNLSSADCELVEEFARQILPKLAAREVKSDITCVPYQESGSRFLLRGQILRALPRAEQSPGVRSQPVN